MTMPYERLRSVNYTREFLRSLLDPRQTPKVPRAVRQKAGACLRHYPAQYDVERWGKRDEVEQIKADIAYERAPGVHTYHLCRCSVHNTQGGKCAWCLEQELAVLEGRAEREAQVQEVFDQVAEAANKAVEKVMGVREP